MVSMDRHSIVTCRSIIFNGDRLSWGPHCLKFFHTFATKWVVNSRARHIIVAFYFLSPFYRLAIVVNSECMRPVKNIIYQEFAHFKSCTTWHSRHLSHCQWMLIDSNLSTHRVPWIRFNMFLSAWKDTDECVVFSR